VRRRSDRSRTPLQAAAERVRRSIRRRLLFAIVAGTRAVMTFLQLASGALLYGAITSWVGAGSITVVRVVEGTLIGGVTTCALAYLMIERSFRPLFAHVLDGVPERRPRTPGIRMRLLLTWVVGSGVPLLAVALILFLDGNGIPAYGLAMLALVGLAAGFIATVSSARSVAEPLDGLRQALARVRDDDLDVGLVADCYPGLAAGIGVSSGRVVAGNVGTEARYEYTVIGPPVNEAARLTDVAKGRAVKVLASAETVRRAAAEAERWHDVGTVAVRGRTAPTAIYEPLVVEPAVSRPEHHAHWPPIASCQWGTRTCSTCHSPR
jgi:class 3 adenylate cyclase